MAMKQDSRHCAGCNRVTLHGKPQFGFGVSVACVLAVLALIYFAYMAVLH